jgi:glycosyltransferase involved in cell wall biosynthesis
VTPKLSIITPSFNQGQYLERTITSVLEQGYPDLEFVVVDGGSTDESVELIRRYEDQLAWWVSEPDHGQADAINKGIRGTSGEVVAYINSDDWFLPGAFDRAIEVLERSGAGYVGGAVLDLDMDGHLTKMGAWRPEPPVRYERFPRGRHWWLIAPFYLPQSSVFWRRELFERNGLFSEDLTYMLDGEFMCRLALAGEKLELIPGEALSVRGVHEDQKSARPSLFDPEMATFPKRLGQLLTPFERVKLRATLLLQRLGVYRAADQIGEAGVAAWALTKLIGPALRFGGNLLEHIPERIRPPVRGRDRRSWDL